MKNFTSEIRLAQDLMVDDWLRIGGQMYRVLSVEQTQANTNFTFYSLANRRRVGRLTVPWDTEIKTYNQK